MDEENMERTRPGGEQRTAIEELRRLETLEAVRSSTGLQRRTTILQYQRGTVDQHVLVISTY